MSLLKTFGTLFDQLIFFHGNLEMLDKATGGRRKLCVNIRFGESQHSIWHQLLYSIRPLEYQYGLKQFQEKFALDILNNAENTKWKIPIKKKDIC